MASATSLGMTFRRALTIAAAPLIDASAAISARSMRHPADREVLDGPLRLRLPLGIGGHPDLAHGVVLDAVVAHACDATARRSLPLPAVDRVRVPGAAARRAPRRHALPAAHDRRRRRSRPAAAASSRSSPRPSPLLTQAGHARHRPPAAPRPPAAAAQHPRRPRGVGQRPLRGPRAAEERRHRRRRRAARLPGHRHRHREGQEGPARRHRRRRRGAHRPRRLPHLRRGQPALLADGAR